MYICNAYITLLLRSRCLIANLLIYGGGGSSSIFACLHQWCHLPVNFLVSLAILESLTDNSLNCQQQQKKEPSNGKLISLAKEPVLLIRIFRLDDHNVNDCMPWQQIIHLATVLRVRIYWFLPGFEWVSETKTPIYASAIAQVMRNKMQNVN